MVGCSDKDHWKAPVLSESHSWLQLADTLLRWQLVWGSVCSPLFLLSSDLRASTTWLLTHNHTPPTPLQKKIMHTDVSLHIYSSHFLSLCCTPSPLSCLVKTLSMFSELHIWSRSECAMHVAVNTMKHMRVWALYCEWGGQTHSWWATGELTRVTFAAEWLHAHVTLNQDALNLRLHTRVTSAQPFSVQKSSRA